MLNIENSAEIGTTAIKWTRNMKQESEIALPKANKRLLEQTASIYVVPSP